MKYAERHIENLTALFPSISERNAERLIGRLAELEAKASELALENCNVGVSDDEYETRTDAILDEVYELLGTDGAPVFLNGDPRGYALKINDEWLRENAPDNRIIRDWGGYGILCPELETEYK